MHGQAAQSLHARLTQIFTKLRDTSHRWVDLVTMVTALFGVVLYFEEGPSRREAHDTAAWQILALQQGHPGNGGRRWAMEVLTADKIDLHGVHLKDADFSSDVDPAHPDADGALLNGARLDWSVLWRSNLKGAHLRGAHLNHAALVCTQLRGADLSHADLSQADLSGANVTAADFTDANLKNARLSRACVNKDEQAPVGLPEPVLRQCPAWDDADNQECKDLPSGAASLALPVASR